MPVTAALAERFRRRFGQRAGAAPRLFRAPGRVNLIGEHTDYNDGFVLPIALPLATWVAAAPRTDRTLVAASEAMDTPAVIDLDRRAPPRRDWTDYVAGVAHALEDEGYRLGGADLLIASDVPRGAGLSSSAALEVSVAMALLAMAGIEVRLKPDTTRGEGEVRLKPDTTRGEGEVRLKPDTTRGEGEVRLKPDATRGEGEVRLKPDTTRGEGEVRLKPDTTRGEGEVRLKPDTTRAGGEVPLTPGATSAGGAIDPATLARACQRAENEFAGARCGIMDQFVATHARAGHALLLDCRLLAHEHVALPGAACFVVANTGVRHQIARGDATMRGARSARRPRRRWACPACAT